MKKQKKTNVMRILDKAGIPYKTKSYDFDLDDLSGVHAAEELGFNPDMVFKTIVTKGNKTGPVVFCLPSNKTLDMKIAASVSGNKSIEMIHLKDLRTLTGYERGACSPIGMKKDFPTYFDESVSKHNEISVSAGHRGQQILICPNSLIKFINAKIYKITLD
ncbi:MAG: Cys-tRNA(Pro) deacylase [Dialister micraerophilus]|uniref:Cys-tRNA(Pro) deacylase n=1 Tax=Dialister micraerophilus TaxID=309120 RepID=UPI00254E807C|nr:Cys-tRNA(Pro) deacylase [Dialister micraerophilus]MDK8253930.1 Cys-tRNA(Pro) deacylase [Dialister micraerophilus]